MLLGWLIHEFQTLQLCMCTYVIHMLFICVHYQINTYSHTQINSRINTQEVHHNFCLLFLTDSKQIQVFTSMECLWEFCFSLKIFVSKRNTEHKFVQLPCDYWRRGCYSNALFIFILINIDYDDLSPDSVDFVEYIHLKTGNCCMTTSIWRLWLVEIYQYNMSKYNSILWLWIYVSELQTNLKTNKKKPYCMHLTHAIRLT